MENFKDAIFVPKKKNEKASAIPDETVYYTTTNNREGELNGHPTLSKNGPKAYAYHETKNGKTRFYAKRAVNGALYNPNNTDTGAEARYLRDRGKEMYAFREMTKNAFIFYLNFLKTGNISWLSNAEREGV